MGAACSTHGVKRDKGFWWGSLKGKRLHEKPKLRWDCIKFVVTETRCEGLDSSHLAQSRDKRQTVVRTVMNHVVSKKAGL